MRLRGGAVQLKLWLAGWEGVHMLACACAHLAAWHHKGVDLRAGYDGVLPLKVLHVLRGGQADGGRGGLSEGLRSAAVVGGHEMAGSLCAVHPTEGCAMARGHWRLLLSLAAASTAAQRQHWAQRCRGGVSTAAQRYRGAVSSTAQWGHAASRCRGTTQLLLHHMRHSCCGMCRALHAPDCGHHSAARGLTW